MKTLLIFLVVAASVLVAQSQTTTNIEVRLREVRLVNGTPSNTNTVNFTLDSAVKKELLMVEGFISAFAQYQAQGGTNDFTAWLRTDFKDRAKSYADAKARTDYATLAATLNNLLLNNPGALNASDLTSLNTIAAKVND